MFVSLSLEDLLFNSSGRNETIDKTWKEACEPSWQKGWGVRVTHIPSFAHHAKHELGLVGRRPGSNLDQSQRLKAIPRRLGIPGSNKINRLAPMRLIPHPPALLLSKNINSFPSGLLNWSTSFCRLLIVIVPSSRKNPYLRVVWSLISPGKLVTQVPTSLCGTASQTNPMSAYSC